MEELYKLLPDRYADVIRARLNIANLYEIRIRNGQPVRVGYGGGYYYLGAAGLLKTDEGAFFAQGDEGERVILRACDRSIYTVADTLRSGYVSVSGGIRIGVCGSAVKDGGAIVAVKDISSVNIRIPHEIKGCASSLFSRLYDGRRVASTLIVSAPGGGKTTVLRDLCRIASDKGQNVLLCDEKYEIASSVSGVPTLDVGKNTDIISGTDKRAVFVMGVANMRPDIIMTDELFGEDTEAALRAAHCGISVVATVHARDIHDFFSKPDYKPVTASHVFSRYAVIMCPERDIRLYSADGEAIWA